MARINYGDPNPEQGIFGCSYAAEEYRKARWRLPEVAAAVTSLMENTDRLLGEAGATYYTSEYGPSGPFRESARKSIEDLEKVSRTIGQFVKDLRANFLRES